jgi:hypothetical protein
VTTHSAVLILAALAVLLLAMDSWARGPVMTLVIIAVASLVLRNEQTIASEFGKLTQPGGPQ